jgi:hypothetical protein
MPVQTIPTSSIEAVEQFYVGKDAYLTFSGPTGSVTAWVFDSVAGKLVTSPLMPSDICGAGGVCRLSGFDSKGSQWIIAASTAGNVSFSSELIIYRNNSLGCATNVACNSTWNIVQKVPANGAISTVQVD